MESGRRSEGFPNIRTASLRIAEMKGYEPMVLINLPVDDGESYFLRRA